MKMFGICRYRKRLYLLEGILLAIEGAVFGGLWVTTTALVALVVGACVAVVFYLTALAPLRSHVSKRKTSYGQEVYSRIQSLTDEGYGVLIPPHKKDVETACVLIGMSDATSEAVITRLGWGATCPIDTVHRRYVVNADGSVRRYLIAVGSKEPSRHDRMWLRRLLCDCRLEYLLDAVKHSYVSMRQIVRQ